MSCRKLWLYDKIALVSEDEKDLEAFLNITGDLLKMWQRKGSDCQCLVRWRNTFMSRRGRKFQEPGRKQYWYWIMSDYKLKHQILFEDLIKGLINTSNLSTGGHSKSTKPSCDD